MLPSPRPDAKGVTAQFTYVADHAVLVSFAEAISDAAHAQVISLDRALQAAPPDGMIEAVPALVNLMVSFDPRATDHRRVEAAIRTLLKDLKQAEVSGVERLVQVCYEAPFAPDLEPVANAVDLSEEAVINAHLAGDYKVLMYGFSPGYAYLSGVAPEIQVPRKPSPLRDVPDGSVIIAGPQCLVTTLVMPTGWSIIGRSPTQILTGDADRPFLFDVGDTVRFKRIDQASFARLKAEGADV